MLMERSRRALLSGLIGLAILLSGLEACSAEAAGKKGAFAFKYSTLLSEEELAWLERFEIAVPGDVLPDWQVQRLRQAGARIFLYAWATGDYIDDPTALAPPSWEATLWKNRADWLLNPDSPAEGPDGQWRSYYYDPGSSAFRRARVSSLRRTTRDARYDGVFFDLSTSLSVPEGLLDVYDARHPDRAYDEAHAELLRELNQKGVLIFTNQGYRVAASYLPAIQYDLSESLIVSTAGPAVSVVVEGQGLVERRETAYSSWRDLKGWVDDIQRRVERYNPAVRILHLGYIGARLVPAGWTEAVGSRVYPVFLEAVDRAAIFYAFAAARLWGHDSYAAGDTLALTRDEIYFTDLGEPVSWTYEERDGVVMRHYERGVVVIGAGTEVVTVDLDSPAMPGGVTGLVDLYTQTTLDGTRVTIEPTRSEASGQPAPAGRVYLYIGGPAAAAGVGRAGRQEMLSDGRRGNTTAHR